MKNKGDTQQENFHGICTRNYTVIIPQQFYSVKHS